MDIIKKIKIILEEAKISGEYMERTVPSSMMRMDNELNKIIEDYASLSEENRKSVEDKMPTDIAWSLLCFAIKMATYSLRSSEQKFFTNGLMALGMILNILDQREILLIMPLYYDVSKRNNLSFKTILGQNDNFAAFLKDFLNRDEKDKALECMGYTLTKDKDGNPIYQRTW